MTADEGATSDDANRREKLSQAELQDVILRFFNTAVADLFRAVRGGCLLGSFTQSMCAIAAMAELRKQKQKTKDSETFESWVTEYMVPLNSKCQPRSLYALRCGLVHAHGYALAMEKVGIKAFRYVHDKPELHWKPADESVTLNLDSHLAEVSVAAYCFFDDAKSKPALREHVLDKARQLLDVQSVLGVQRLVENLFARMDSALEPFDRETRPQELVPVIRDNVRRLYLRNNVGETPAS